MGSTPKAGYLVVTGIIVFGGSNAEAPPAASRVDHEHVLELEAHGAIREPQLRPFTTTATNGSTYTVHVGRL
jgi:hypothetical protein